MKKSFVIISSLLLITGCASAITRGFAIDHKRHDYYPATKFDLVCMYETSLALRQDLMAMAGFLVCLIDTPISLTIDTICFPYDIYDFYKAQKIKEGSKDTRVSQQQKGNNKIDKLKDNNNTEKDYIDKSKNNIGSPDENINSKPDNASTSQSLQSANPGKAMSAAEVERAVPSNLPVSSSTPASSHGPEKLSVKLGDTIDNVRSAYHTSAEPEPVKSNTPGSTYLRLKDTGIWFFFDQSGKIYTIRLESPFQEIIKGIKIGDSLAKVIKTLGEPDKNEMLFENSSDRLFYPHEGLQLWLDSAGTVTTIFLTR